METKKMYEQPQTVEVKIATSQILCYSGGNQGDNTDNPAPRFDPEW